MTADDVVRLLDTAAVSEVMKDLMGCPGVACVMFYDGGSRRHSGSQDLIVSVKSIDDFSADARDVVLRPAMQVPAVPLLLYFDSR
jgi:hypothetical protein